MTTPAARSTRRSRTSRRTLPSLLAIDTDLDGGQYEALQALLKKFPFGGQVQDSLRQQLEEGTNVDFNDDVRPVLGNPFVVGAADVESFIADSGGSAFVAAIQAKDKDALDELIDKTKPKKTGEESGATLYEENGTVFAVEDDTVIFAGDRQQLTQALARADGDDHLDEDTFNEGLDGLPDSALARVYADVEALLKNDPDTADARKIKWIDALRTLGATVVARDDGIDVDFRLRTEGDLSDEDLPIAPGDEAPEVIKQDGEIGLGIRDLAHIVKFAENAGQAVDPAGFGDYAKAKADDRQAARSEPRRRPDRAAHGQRCLQHLARRQVRRARRAQGPGRRSSARSPRWPTCFRASRRAPASAPWGCRSRRAARTSTHSRSPTATSWCSG